MQTPLRLTGIGLRPAHYADFLEKKPPVAWVEVHSENYFGEGGKPLSILHTIRTDYPISFHGVGLSLGSADDLNWQHLKCLKNLSQQIEPCLISEHLSWSSINGQYLHDLLPLPYTEEALSHLVKRILQIQDYLQRSLLIENISNYIAYPHSIMAEWEFLAEVAKQSGCSILLDVNNLYVSQHHLGYDLDTYLRYLSPHHVQEIHLAGFSSTLMDGKEILIDSHNKPVSPAVFALYQETIRLMGAKPTIIEWDEDLPSLDTLCLEAARAEEIIRKNHAITKPAK